MSYYTMKCRYGSIARLGMLYTDHLHQLNRAIILQDTSNGVFITDFHQIPPMCFKRGCGPRPSNVYLFSIQKKCDFESVNLKNV